jgi:hypothetical protein
LAQTIEGAKPVHVQAAPDDYLFDAQIDAAGQAPIEFVKPTQHSLWDRLLDWLTGR